jgi:hypothetical protein
MRETVSTVRSRFRARRWQRRSEVPPEDDYLRWSRAITIVATSFFLLVLVGIVLALVLR